MKTIFNISVLAVLLVVAASPCFAEMLIQDVSKARAKALDMEIRSTANGPDAVWVELEFEAKGELKSFDRANLEIRDVGKFVLSSSLKEGRSKPGHVVVSFTADRAHLDQITMVVVVGAPEGYTGYKLRVKDFVDLEKVK